MVDNNSVAISGNLTRDPDMRYTQSGMAILSIGVAVNDEKKNPNTGQYEEFPNFIDCTMFGNRAEGVSRYLHKGTKVSIEGKLRYSSWNDKETGKNRSKLEVLIDNIVFFNQQQGAQQNGYQQQVQQPPMQQGYYAAPTAQQYALQYAQPMQQPMQQPQYAQPAQQAPTQPMQAQQKPQQAPQPAQPQYAPQPAPAQPQQPMQQPQQASIYDEDIPF